MPSSSRSSRRVLAVLLALVASVFLAPVAAQAHTQLQSTSPAENATLTTVPDEVALTFSEDLGEASQLAVSTADGTSVAAAEAEVDGPTISIAIAPDAPGGEWTVGYRVISADGHPVSGDYTFTVQAPTATATPTPEETAAATTPAATPAATDAAHPSPDVGSAGDDGGSSWWIAVAVVVVLAIAAVGGIVLSRRRRR